MLFQKHFILLISVSFIDLLKRDLAARVGGGGGREGHTSNANLLLNNSAKYGDNFLTVNLPIFKSCRKCSSDNFILTNLQYENYLNVFVFVFFFLPFGWHSEALHNNIFPATSHRVDIAKD